MSQAVLFVGTYEIPPGGAEAFREQVAAMNRVVAEHEPRIAFIGHYVNADETEGTSIHLHPDADSFDTHMAAAARAIDHGVQVVTVKRIELYGRPSDAALELLASFDVTVKDWADGFSRIAAV